MRVRVLNVDDEQVSTPIGMAACSPGIHRQRRVTRAAMVSSSLARRQCRIQRARTISQQQQRRRVVVVLRQVPRLVRVAVAVVGWLDHRRPRGVCSG